MSRRDSHAGRRGWTAELRAVAECAACGARCVDAVGCSHARAMLTGSRRPTQRVHGASVGVVGWRPGM